MTWGSFASGLLGSGVGIVLYQIGAALVRRHERRRARRWQS